MNPNWQGQGGDPNGHGAYYNPAPRLQEGTPLQQLTSYPLLQPRGGYYLLNQSSSGGDILPTDGNIVPGYDLAPLAVRMHWDPEYHHSMLVAPGASTSNAIASQNQYQPHPGPAAVFPAPAYNPAYQPAAAVYAQQPGSAAFSYAPGYNTNPLATAYQYQPGAQLHAQPVAATDFSAWGGNANNDPYASAALIPPPANANQVAGVPYRRSHPELRKARGNHLLGAVQRYNIQRANMPGDTGDLQAIVNSVISEQYYNGLPLMEVATHSSGELALQELFKLAAQDLGLEALWCLFKCLADGWIMEQSNGPDLLKHFFTRFHYGYCSIFVRELAVRRFWFMLTSRPGSTSLMRCVEIAGDTEQGLALQATIVAYTVEIASSDPGAFFLETIFKEGSNVYLKERIRERVLGNLVELSMGRYGNYVVQACFVPDHRVPLHLVPLLQHGIQAFLHLPDEQLRQLVQDHSAGCVLRRLLRTSVCRAAASAEAMQLADRMLGAGAAGGVGLPAGDRREQAIAILQ